MPQNGICNCGYIIYPMRTFWSGNSAFIWNIPKHISFLLGSNSVRTKINKDTAQQLHGWIPLIPPVLKPYWPWRFQKEWFAWSWQCCDELDHGVVRWLRWNFITWGWGPVQVGTRMFFTTFTKNQPWRFVAKICLDCMAMEWSDELQNL